MNLPREDVVKLIQASDMPILLKAAVSSFIKALPQSEFDKMVANVMEAGAAVVSNDPAAETKLSMLGIPPQFAKTLIKEAQSRAH